MDLFGQVYNMLIQLVLVAIPIVLSWFIRNYIRGNTAEKKIGTVVRLANAAIDYVENLDRRGDLMLPGTVKKGGHKLQLAAEWLENELGKSGLTVSTEEAKQWVASEFQRRVGGVQMVGTVAELTKRAVEMIEALESNKTIELPAEADRITYLAGLAADWVVAQFAMQGGTITRAEAVTWVRAELLEQQQMRGYAKPNNSELATLARQAASFVEGLKATGQLVLQPGVPRATVETDVATAWLLTEIAKRGLAVSSEEITQAIRAALKQKLITVN